MVKKSTDIIYPALSYKIMGILFKVHRTLGGNYQEKYYQRAIENDFKKEKISYKRELMVNLNYGEFKIGKYYLDFFVEDKIALEIKAVPVFKKDYYSQVLAYLDAVRVKLGIIANFRAER